MKFDWAKYFLYSFVSVYMYIYIDVYIIFLSLYKRHLIVIFC